MITSLILDAAWRDFWGQFNPPAAAQMAPLELAGCYRPRLALLPNLQSQIIPTAGKIEYAFNLRPGSIVWGMFLDATAVSAIQIEDVNLGHRFFQEPIAQQLLTLQQTGLGSPVVITDFPPYTLLPGPHPVVGDGLFMFQAWGKIGTRVQIQLGVAEEYECP